MSISARLFSLWITCLKKLNIENRPIIYTHFSSFSRRGWHCLVKHGDLIGLGRTPGFGQISRVYCKMRNYGSWHWGHSIRQNSLAKQWEMISLLSEGNRVIFVFLSLSFFLIWWEKCWQSTRNALTKFFLMSNYECLSCP